MDKEHIINISNKHQDKIKKLENQIIELNFQIAERSKIDNKPGSQNRMVDLELKVKRLRYKALNCNIFYAKLIIL